MATNDYFAYWGKAQNNALNGEPYHLLAYHSLDVAAVAWHLFAPERPLLQDLANYLNVEGGALRRLLCALAAVHDIGKFASSFQALFVDRSAYLNLTQTCSKAPYDGVNFRHDMLGWPLISAGFLHGFWQLPPDLPQEWDDGVALLFGSVLGHHGKPIKMYTTNWFDEQYNLGSTYQDYVVEQDIDAALMWLNAVEALFKPDCTILSLTDSAAMMRLRHISWQIAAVVMRADWLGSDVRYFPYCSQPRSLTDYWDEALHRAEAALRSNGGWTIARPRPFKGFTETFGFSPTPLQAWAEQVELSELPQLFILEDITGAGKTEAALTLVQRLMHAGHADGFYFGLPTRATANAMFSRIRNHYRSMYQAGDAVPSVILAHASAHMNESFTRIIEDDVLLSSAKPYAPADSSAEAQCQRWYADSRKRALLADVGVGTIDQALMAALPVRHQALRLHGLHRKILIYDELHSADAFMTALLKGLLDAHLHQGGSVILLTATLSLNTRRDILDAWRCAVLDEAPPLELSTAFPLATQMIAGDAQPRVQAAIASRNNVARQVDVRFLDHEAAVLIRIQEAVARGQSVVWVRNTVQDAQEAYTALAALGISKLTLFHSRYTLDDRARIEAYVLTHLGKNSHGAQRSGQVIVATQVFQESLDVDADVIISDLCPIDYLLQRAGRLHRHCRDLDGNPAEYEQRGAPTLWIYAPVWADEPQADWFSKQFSVGQWVYQNTAQLWLTHKILRERQSYRLPDDARLLLESVYGDELELPPALLEADISDQSKARLKSHQGHDLVLNWAKGYSSESHHYWYDSEAVISSRFNDQPSEDIVLLRRGSNGDYTLWAEDGNAFAYQRSIIRVSGALAKKLTPLPLDNTQQQTLCQRYRQLQYATAWCPEQDENYSYDEVCGLIKNKNRRILQNNC